MQSHEVAVLDQEEIQNESQQYPMKAQELALSIKDDASYQSAGEFLVTIKGFRKKVEETFGPVVKRAYDAWKATTELRKQADGPLDEAEKIIKPALARYADEQERKQRAEADRIMAEQKKRDDDRRIAEAEAAVKNGDHAAADAILEAPAAPLVVPTVPKAVAPGISYSTVWKGEVVDLKALVKAIAEGSAPLTLIEANTAVIGSMAKSLKAEFKYPGIKVWGERVVSGRAK